MIKISNYAIVAGTTLCALQTATGPPAYALDGGSSLPITHE